MHRRGIRSAAILLSLLFFAAATEIASRIVYPHATTEAGRRSVDVITGTASAEELGAFRPHPYGLYVNAPNWEAAGFKQNNSYGYRGAAFEWEKPKGVIRILTLGGSTTYNYPGVLDPAQTWSAQLEHLLIKSGHRVQIINGGLNAGTSGEVLTQYIFRHRHLKPDIIIYDAGWNDSWPVMLSDYQPDYATYRRWQGFPIHARAGEQTLLRHSYFFRILYAHWLGNPKLGDLILFPKEFYDITAEKAYENVKRNAPVGYARNLDVLATLARQDGAQLVLFSEPTAPLTIFDTYHDAWSKRLYPVMRQAFEKVKDVTRETARKRGAVHAEMQQDSIPAEDFIDHAHTNASGEALKAAFLAERLRPVLAAARTP